MESVKFTEHALELAKLNMKNSNTTRKFLVNSNLNSIKNACEFASL